MALPDLTGQDIEKTYQRIIHTGNGTTFYDGTGSLVNIGGGTGNPGGPNTSIQFNSASAFSGSNNLKFDYTTNNVILTGSLLVTQSYISTVDYIDFTKLPLVSLPAHNEGRLHWFDDTKTLQIDTDKNGFMVEIGHQNVVRVYNDTGADIALGKVVRISGSQGNQPSIVTSSWDNDQSSAATLGFTATLINGTGGNKHGYVVTNGILRNVNTIAYPVGTQLYLSSSGDFTNTPPDAPLHEVRLGKVIVSNNTTGVIYVDIMNGYELTELHDVRTTTYSDGDLLIQSNSLWTNSKQLTGSYGLTGSLTISGSFTVLTGSGVEFQVTNTGIRAGNTVTDLHSVTGSLNVSNNALFVSGGINTVGINTNSNVDVINGTDYLRIVASGSGGANTVFGFSNNAGTGQGFMSVTNGTVTGFGAHVNNSDGMVFGSFNSFPLTLRTANQNRFRLDSSGNPYFFNVPNISATNLLVYNPSSGLVSYVSSSVYAPSNVLVTASVASNVLTFTKGDASTFSLTVATGSGGGGGGTPGGADESIQFNATGAFAGNVNKLSYRYATVGSAAERLLYASNQDFITNPFDNSQKGSINIVNIGGGNNKQSAGITHWQYSLGSNIGATVIYAFDANGGVPGDLNMQGFKCDYSLLLHDGSNKVASRVGTLMGAWSYNTNITPVITDTYVDGDQVYNELGTVIFTLGWNGANIELYMDCTNVSNGTTYFNGLFTNFGNGL